MTIKNTFKNINCIAKCGRNASKINKKGNEIPKLLKKHQTGHTQQDNKPATLITHPESNAIEYKWV